MKDKKQKNVLDLMKKSPTKDAVSTALEQQHKPQEQQKPNFALTLIPINQELKALNIVVTEPPATVIVIKNREMVFIFSHVQVTETGPVYIYTEASTLMFSIDLPSISKG